MVTNLQIVVGPTLTTFPPAVVTVGGFRAGDPHNLISGTAEPEETVRTFDDSDTAAIKARAGENLGRLLYADLSRRRTGHPIGVGAMTVAALEAGVRGEAEVPAVT